MVLIDAVTLGRAAALKAALIDLGLQRAAVYANDVGGWLRCRSWMQRRFATKCMPSVPPCRARAAQCLAGRLSAAQHWCVRRIAGRRRHHRRRASDSYDCYAAYGAAGSGVPASGPTGYAPYGFTPRRPRYFHRALPSTVNVLEEAEQGNAVPELRRAAQLRSATRAAP